MKKIVKLNESDLRKMVSNVINEIMCREEGPEMGNSGDKYYFNVGFDKHSSRGFGSENSFEAEGSVGDGFEVFLEGVNEYVQLALEMRQSKKPPVISYGYPLNMSVVMPSEDGHHSWRDYVQFAAPKKRFQIDPENVEGSAKQAWNTFNDYASNVDGVIGWYLWHNRPFDLELRPILTPEIGEMIDDEGDNIQRFYDSLGYKGD